MSDKIVLFCKSYSKDMLRARRMTESVMRFNKDGIPLYVSVPERDLNDFCQCFEGLPCNFITDEQILAKSIAVFGPMPDLFPTHLLQQLIKLEFWRMKVCLNYAWVDSDSYFIKDFCVHDFLKNGEIPFVIEDEYAPDTELTLMNHVPKKTRERRVNDITTLISRFRGVWNNTGTFLAFGGSTPIIWSCRVLESMYLDYLDPAKKSIYELLYEYPCETQLYGEYVHTHAIIPVYPKSHMFKSYYHADDFYISEMNGEYEYSLAKDYFGICIQSNWAMIKEKKDTSERLKKHFHEMLRFCGLLSFAKKEK